MGDSLEGATRRCAALDAVHVLEACSFAIAGEAVTAASPTKARRLNTENFVTAGFSKGNATKS
jgi:hypothetical protein